MRPEDLVSALESCTGRKLAGDLVHEFLQIQQDLRTATLGRSSPGKFVETTVQVMQTLSGEHPDPDGKVDVDAFLRKCENGQANPPGDLRIAGARIARAMYGLRSKRNILHKGKVDPNLYDLRVLHQAAQWLLAEVIRVCTGADATSAGRMAEFVQLPISELVEEFDTERLVTSTDATPRDELLLLMRSYYPERVSRTQLGKDMQLRAPSTVTRTLQRAVADKLVHRDNLKGYKLTGPGWREAERSAERLSTPSR